MADATIIGLGHMGSVLARTLVEAGFETVVWNRTAARADPLVEAGAVYLAEPAEAVSASPVVVVCVSDYAASDSILRTPKLRKALQGRVLVQLSSGSPRLARQADDWVSACGASYLDGDILAFPRGIGTANCAIVIAGDEAGFARSESVLRTLAPKLEYVGTKPESALILSSAVLLTEYAFRFGVMNGAAICEATGFSKRQFAHIARVLLTDSVDELLQDVLDIDDNDYEETQASLTVWKEALPPVIEVSEGSGCDSALLLCMQAIFDRAVRQGWGESGIAALSKSLQGKTSKDFFDDLNQGQAFVRVRKPRP